ncbi:MAG: hypothetical protein J6J11_00255 [Treponema sp.]|nr:hypothetical protein [Clostridia bacterium]MBP3606743.1 hypothetical protein [Treponema sp.]
MSVRNMSAKDRAFQKEREKLNKQITLLHKQLHDFNVERLSFTYKIMDLEEENRMLKDWNDRLLNYLDMSEDEFKQLLESERTRMKIEERLSSVFSFSEKLGGGLFV